MASRLYRRSSKPEVADLAVELRDVVDDFDELAIHLPGITVAHVSTARANALGNVSRLKLYVYQKWRDVCVQASWNDVVRALDTVGLNDKARDLDKRLSPASATGGSTTISQPPGLPASNGRSSTDTTAGSSDAIAETQQSLIDILNKYNPMLAKMVRGEVLKQFAREMLAKKLIMDDQILDPSYDDIMATYKASLSFQNTTDKLANYCTMFVAIVKSLGGPLEGAADTIDEEWKHILRNRH